MKFLPLLSLVSLAVFPSCGKIKDLASRFGKKPLSATPAAPAAVSGRAEVVEISGDTFNNYTQQSGKVVIVDFYADWCGPCRQLAPILEKISAEHGGNVIVCKLNVDKHQEFAIRENISSIPEVRIFRDGKMIDKFVGLPTESEIREKIEAATKELPPPAPASASDKKAGYIKPMTKDWMPEGIQRR